MVELIEITEKHPVASLTVMLFVALIILKVTDVVLIVLKTTKQAIKHDRKKTN